MNAPPLILTLDQNGQPHRWVSWQHACFYYARDMVAWAAGEHTFTLWGGRNRISGRRSCIAANSIIAIRGRPLSGHHWGAIPPLNNRELFRRDRHTCAYCGQGFTAARLTRDHIHPLSQGGADQWMNVVAACQHCNQKKGGRSPEQARMTLLFAPYVPSKAEYLILSNRQILADQMDFLSRQVSPHSRIYLP